MVIKHKVNLPAGGYWNGTTLNGAEEYAEYWTSTFVYRGGAAALYFDPNRLTTIAPNNIRYMGLSIRAVK